MKRHTKQQQKQPTNKIHQQLFQLLQIESIMFQFVPTASCPLTGHQ